MFSFSKHPKLKYEIHEFGRFKTLLLLQPDWDDGFITIMKDIGANVLRMTPGHVVKDQKFPGGEGIEPIGWNDTELSFLDNIPSNLLVGLDYGINQPVELSRLSGFPRLRYLSIPSKFTGLPNLTSFKNLEIFETCYRKSMASVFDCSWLKHLRLSSYPFADLTPLSKMTELQYLQISGRKIETLKGISELAALNEVEILHATSLKHVDDLADQTNVKKVTLFRCGEVEGIDRYVDLIDTCEGMN